MSFDFKKEKTSLLVAIAIGIENRHPTLDRITLGLYKSVLRLVMIRASTFAASTVRANAPMFPGFSGASAIRISGFSFSLSTAKLCSFFCATPRISDVDR